MTTNYVLRPGKARHKRYLVARIRNGKASIIGLAPDNAQAEWLLNLHCDLYSETGDILVATSIADDHVTPWWKDRLKLRKFLEQLVQTHGTKGKTK